MPRLFGLRRVLRQQQQARAQPNACHARPNLDAAHARDAEAETGDADEQIGDTVAMAAVGDQFGIEQSTAAREGLTKAGFKLVYDKSYPFGTQDLQPIAAVAEEYLFPEGETLAVEGEPGDTMYVIVDGEVQVLGSDEQELAVRGPGDFICEMAAPALASPSTTAWKSSRS